MKQTSTKHIVESKHMNMCTGDRKPELSEEDIPYLRENYLIEMVKSAFGESRGGQKRKPSDEALQWIFSAELEKQELPFSFRQCCFSCGVDPETMLEWLRYYKRKFLG